MADGVKISSLPSATTPSDNDVIAGVQSGTTKKFSFALIKNWIQNLFVPKTDVGAANGVASLDSTGKVPGTQLDLSNIQNKITANGILKGDGQGGVSAATPGTDYQTPLTAGTDYATPAQLVDKAAKADLTSIQATGTTNTTGAAIPAGAYFYLNGVFYRAKTQIDQNATFTVNTNCEQTTVSKRIRKYSLPKTTNGVGNISILSTEVENLIPVSVTITDPSNVLYIPLLMRYAGNFLVRVLTGSLQPVTDTALTLEIIAVEA